MALGGETKWLKKQSEDWSKAGGKICWAIIIGLILVVLLCITFFVDDSKDSENQAIPTMATNAQEFTGPRTDDNGNPMPEYLEYLELQKKVDAYNEMQQEEMMDSIMKEEYYNDWDDNYDDAPY